MLADEHSIPKRLRRSRLVKILASAVVGLALSLTLISCGSQTTVYVSDAAPPGSEDPEATLQSGYESWAGSIASRQAAQVLKAHALNGAWDDCLVAEGVKHVSWKASIGGIEVPWYFGSVPGLLNDQRIFSREIEVNASTSRAESQLRVDVAAEDRASINNCRQQYPGMSDQGLEQLTEPEVLPVLQQRWGKLVATTAKDLPDEATLLACAAKELDVKQTMSTLDSPPSMNEVPIAGEPSSDVWKGYLAAEESFLSAMQGCHGDSYDKALSLLLGAASEFENANSAEIAEAKAFWGNTQAEAQKLGWRVEDPLAGLSLLPAESR